MLNYKNLLMLLSFLILSYLNTSAQNYVLVWSDEFNGRNLNENIWIRETGGNGWGNEEIQFYTDRDTNAYIQNGKLVIQALKESYNGRDYTSARLKTEGNRFFKYGRIEASIKLPSGKGIWPAFWMLGENFSTVGWPACGEIDIMEKIGGVGFENIVYGTVHWDNNGQHAEYGGSYRLSSGNFADGFHLFAVEWSPQNIKWFVDGIQYHIIDITPSDLSEFRNNFFIILNIAVGGLWPGYPDESTELPQKMEVDFIRVYQEESKIPKIYLEKPFDNSNYDAFENVELTTSVDFNGEIEKVLFYQGDMQIGETDLEPFNMIWRNVNPGEYDLKAIVKSTEGYFGGSSVNNIKVGEESILSPYSGNPAMIPGIIEAENFDIGGAEVAYMDNSAANIGNAYRISEAVDIEVCNDKNEGFNIGWAETGEWLIYSVHIEETAEYEIASRVASEYSNANFYIEINGEAVTEIISVPNTGGWQNWVTVNSTIFLNEGDFQLKFVVESGELNINSFEIYKPDTNPLIKLIEPKGGETYEPGLIQEIRWSQLKVDEVSIGLSIDGGNNWSFIAKDITSQFGFYRWMVPESKSKNCKIMIIDSEVSTINDMNDSTFSIDFSTSILEENEVPDEINLYQNYPNPFNPETVIKYYLPGEYKVKLEIFNNNGEKVEIINEKSKVRGNYEIKWNGRDRNGLPLASGIYFYRIVAINQGSFLSKNFTKTKKMILLR